MSLYTKTYDIIPDWDPTGWVLEEDYCDSTELIYRFTGTVNYKDVYNGYAAMPFTLTPEGFNFPAYPCAFFWNTGIDYGASITPHVSEGIIPNPGIVGWYKSASYNIFKYRYATIEKTITSDTPYYFLLQPSYLSPGISFARVYCDDEIYLETYNRTNSTYYPYSCRILHKVNIPSGTHTIKIRHAASRTCIGLFATFIYGPVISE